MFTTSSIDKRDLINSTKELAIPNQSDTDLLNQALDEKVKSMMEKGHKMMADGEERNGTPRRRTSSICKVCGKEGLPKHIKKHIESHHLEGISIQCDHCGKNFSSRDSLTQHKNKFHK